MEVRFRPEVEKKLNELSLQTGQPAGELVEDVMAGYLDGVAALRQMIESRYHDLKSGQVAVIDGEAFFESLRQREEELVKAARANEPEF
jgi:predicted DNA-binding protein